MSIRLVTLFLAGTAVWAAIPKSPAIESLKRDLRLPVAGAVEGFWAEVERSGGTPLVECPSTLAPQCLVTFLWRGDASTRNVVVRGEALPGMPAKHLFQHLTGTDVWYRTYKFRNDARFMYMLSIDDPLTSWDVEGPERQKRYAGVRTDPLNRRNGSYVSLPQAPSERWSEEHPGVARGEIRPYSIASTALSGDRQIEVYETPGFRPSAESITPVLILFDGLESRQLLRAPRRRSSTTCSPKNASGPCWLCSWCSHSSGVKWICNATSPPMPTWSMRCFHG